jgi:hypothetical protein
MRMMETTRPSSASYTLPPERQACSASTSGKQVHNASSKVNLVVHKMLLPLLDAPLRTHVVFDAEADQAELDLMEEVDKSHPRVMEDPTSFVQHLQSLLSRYKAYASGYSRVHNQVVLVDEPVPGAGTSGARRNATA